MQQLAWVRCAISAFHPSGLWVKTRRCATMEKLEQQMKKEQERQNAGKSN
jgi:hypothetical protein